MLLNGAGGTDEHCLCVDPTLPCYQDHYDGVCGCCCDDCAGSEPESSGGGSSGSTAPDDPTPMYGSAGASAGCADNGDSCASDGAIVTAKTECGGNPPTQRPCYCAAALTYDCFLKHGCYAEAGASTSVTKAQLEIGRDGENNKAVALGAGCW